ncbi:hypothetical protein BJ973_001005 [Actinoplanes tereljensis]|uniref:Pycsar effector protein domain-containing protein n=1 Tax=Paractinoplanes tereljensis TaxID=571912 RepID=A0A919NZ18_9ACTN|nr:Pycsar system effector family protein [Actinoplanes tereljensis]GIF26561.1 hypothetical protein Ate02nite_92910 [Actinoplanes tereljensis]
MATRKDQAASPPPPPPATDDAWRALQLQFDLVKHAETKAAAALASCGVLGGLLYTLVAQTRTAGTLFTVVATLAAATIVTSGIAAGIALRPRQLLRKGSPSLLFYRTITARFGYDADAFAREFAGLSTDRSALMSALTGQILSNANVATRKYRAVNVAVLGLLAALGLMAATAAIGLTSR